MTSIRLKIEESWYASMDCKVQKSGLWVCFYGGHSTGSKLGNHPKNIEPCAHRARTVRAPCAHRATTPPRCLAEKVCGLLGGLPEVHQRGYSVVHLPHVVSCGRRGFLLWAGAPGEAGAAPRAAVTKPSAGDYGKTKPVNSRTGLRGSSQTGNTVKLSNLSRSTSGHATCQARVNFNCS